MTPETRYARSGDVNIAYQVVGDAPRDLVLVPGWVSNVEIFWEEPTCASTVKDLVAGSGLRFQDRGPQSLKGVPGEWHLFALESDGHRG
jgi:hypothetical protein